MLLRSDEIFHDLYYHTIEEFEKEYIYPWEFNYRVGCELSIFIRRLVNEGVTDKAECHAKCKEIFIKNRKI